MSSLDVLGMTQSVGSLRQFRGRDKVADLTQLLKGNSSKWIHNTFKEHWEFEWQEGYGAFSIGVSGVDDTIKYIEGQREHHRTLTFRDELEIFLKKHEMEYVNRDLD